MSFWDKLDKVTAFFNSIANVSEAKSKKAKITSNKSIEKKIGKLEKSLHKHLIINIIVATVFFILGLATPMIISYFHSP